MGSMDSVQWDILHNTHKTFYSGKLFGERSHDMRLKSVLEQEACRVGLKFIKYCNLNCSITKAYWVNLIYELPRYSVIHVLQIKSTLRLMMGISFM